MSAIVTAVLSLNWSYNETLKVLLITPLYISPDLVLSTRTTDFKQTAAQQQPAMQLLHLPKSTPTGTNHILAVEHVHTVAGKAATPHIDLDTTTACGTSADTAHDRN
jgi:hypothetical protein